MTMTETQAPDRAIVAFDRPAADAFGARLLEVMNGAALAMMLSVGHRTGLFDAMASLPASSSQEIADAAGLQERYVREWLGAMVTGGVVRYDATHRAYHLPAAHAALLTRGAPLGNFAASMQWVAVLGGVESKIIERFRHGGGVHYHECHRFHECMAEESAQTVVAALREHILPLVPGLIGKLDAGIRVLDVGCGSGLAMCEMAQAFPASRFMGVDICADAIAAARAEAERRGLNNLRFEVADDSNLNELVPPGGFELVTGFDVVHDQRDPHGLLREVGRVLKPGGTFLMQDIRASSHVERNIGHPMGTFLYTISTMHCMSVSLAQGGAGLGTCWGEELALQMLDEAGFKDVRVHTLPHDIMNNFYVMSR